HCRRQADHESARPLCRRAKNLRRAGERESALALGSQNDVTPDELLALLQQRGALLNGHFRLSSGLHSDRFIQKFRIFEDPPTAEAVGAALADLLRPYKPQG